MNEEVHRRRLDVLETNGAVHGEGIMDQVEPWHEPGPAEEDPDLYLGDLAYAHPPPAHGFAVASLVFGVLGLMVLFGIGPLLALFFGYVGRARIKRRLWGGDGLAIAGIVLGWIGMVVALAIAFAFGFASTDVAHGF